MASFGENKSFYDEVVKPGYFGIQTDSNFLLDAALDWIEANIMIEQSLDEAIDTVKLNCEPEDVFSEDQLASWAEFNGFVEEE